jgi:TonB family protein
MRRSHSNDIVILGAALAACVVSSAHGADPSRKPPPTIRTPPRIDAEACARTVKYPQEAREGAIEGDVKLRVTVDAEGKVTDVTVLKGLGGGLTEAAVDALKHKCRFSPAIDSNGKRVSYVIPTYTWSFALPE